jgi:hypothetical protein
MTLDQQQRAISLYEELYALRERARSLPVDDMERGQLSQRAGEIGRELTAITGEAPGMEQ